MFKKILVANRGEIAVRVMSAIRAVGAIPVAIYSDADRSALHVQMADEAYRIGPPPPGESYLSIDAVLAAAHESGSDAIHPGYGFLSENAEFAAAVSRAGHVFIGPPAEVIRLMGDKTAAKRLMSEAGVPVIPGYLGEDQTEARLLTEAERVGYPLMIKAAAGGGGRGMRRVLTRGEMSAAIAGARREAEGAFGDGRLFLEKLLVAPRHIEVQILADAHGSVVHLGERDCSIQRRHQKIVEEAPSTALNAAARAELGSVAIRGAIAAGYVNAGTMEFLWSAGSFYFLEMNTRIQVEHPVTEVVTGIDLVKTQIEIASGWPLGFDQQSVTFSGHAVECRLYAEDPDQNFLPQAGRIERFQIPVSGSDIRIDTGVYSGAEVPQFYDPLLAKIIAHGSDRATAIRHLQAALTETRVSGIKTNLEFLRRIVSSRSFAGDNVTTAFLDDDSWEDAQGAGGDGLERVAVAAAGVDLLAIGPRPAPDQSGPRRRRPVVRGWRTAGELVPLAYEIDGRRFQVLASRRSNGYWEVSVNGVDCGRAAFTGNETSPNGLQLPDLVLMMGHEVRRYRVEPSTTDHDAFRLEAWLPEAHGSLGRVELRDLTNDETAGRAENREPGGRARAFEVLRLPAFQGREQIAGVSGRQGEEASGLVVAPMPGSVVKVAAAVGDRVQAHQSLLVMEAMKMEHVLESPHTGTVRSIRFGEGDMVSAGAIVVEVEPD